MTTGKIDKLVRVANQVGDFYAAMPEPQAAEGVATHLRLYWTAKMIRELLEFVDEGHASLNPTAARGVDILKRAPTTS